MSDIQAISDASFEAEVLKSSNLVLVDFWATWCGPCRALAPKLEELSGTYTGKVKFVKIDVDQNPETAGRFGVRGIPTLIVFKNGQMVDQLVGNQPKDVIENVLQKHA